MILALGSSFSLVFKFSRWLYDLIKGQIVGARARVHHSGSIKAASRVTMETTTLLSRNALPRAKWGKDLCRNMQANSCGRE